MREKEWCWERALEICISIPLKFLLNTKLYVYKPGQKKKTKTKTTGAEQFPELTWGWKTVNSDQSGIQNWMEHLEHSEKNLERARLKK